MISLSVDILPGLVFFDPAEPCLNWMAKYINNRPTVDCGSGVGRLSAALIRRRVRVIPIDLFLREDAEADPVVMDILEFPFTENSVGIIARPCRGDWIHDTIDNIMKKNGEVLYIGLHKHYDEDLGPLESKYLLEKLYEDAGDEGEYIYSIKPIYSKGRDKMQTFSLLYCKLQGNFWYKSNGDEWRNSAGGYMPKRDDDVVIETVDALSFDDLDWTRTNILKPDSNIGWLNRSGKFYGCGYMGHDSVAYYILKQDVSELEETGWVRIVSSDEYYCIKRLSPEQRNYLSINGHLVDEDS